MKKKIVYGLLFTLISSLICKYTGASTDITITDTITNSGITYNITEVARNAFQYLEIRSLILGNYIRTIGESAFFSSGRYLSSITIPASVNTIGFSAFGTAFNSAVRDVIIENPVPPVFPNEYLFGNSDGTNAAIDIQVPDGSEQAYIDAGWRGFKSINDINPFFVVDNTTYEIISYTNNEVSIYNYFGSSTTYTIPASVTNSGNTYSITEIGYNSFSEKSLTSITIPNSVNTIGERAFIHNSLTSFTFGSSITSIGDSAFSNNPDLVEMISESTNPAIIERFQDYTFGIPSNIDLTVPSNSEQAYLEANWLGFKSINGISTYFTAGDFVYGITDLVKNEATIFDYSGSDEILTIPTMVTYLDTNYSVTELENWAFYDDGFTEITIPDTITSIGNNTFSRNELTSVTIPASVIFMGSSTFRLNGYLVEVISESTNPAILASGALHYNHDNSNIDLIIPTGTEQAYMDADWTGFKSITEKNTFIYEDIEYRVTTIGTPNEVTIIDYTGSSTSVTIPATVSDSFGSSYNVTSIENSAFLNNKLTSVIIPESITSIRGSVFRNNILTSIVIPESITSIENNTFRANSLESITIPNSTSSIGNHAFYNNDLTSITIH